MMTAKHKLHNYYESRGIRIAILKASGQNDAQVAQPVYYLMHTEWKVSSPQQMSVYAVEVARRQPADLAPAQLRLLYHRHRWPPEAVDEQEVRPVRVKRVSHREPDGTFTLYVASSALCRSTSGQKLTPQG